jgi:hypothetical protein
LRGRLLPSSVVSNNINDSPYSSSSSSNSNVTDSQEDLVSSFQFPLTNTKVTRQSGNPEINQDVPVETQISLSIEPELDK